MNVRELQNLLNYLIVKDQTILDREVRIGDQVESGPYLNASLGSIFKGRNGDLILCANDDEVWKDEAAGYHPDFELDRVWRKPASPKATE